MIRKQIFTLIALLTLPLALSAQTFKFGYYSYDKVVKSMSDYIIAQHNLSELRAQYDAEAKRSEDDFNSKYEAFLDEQSNLSQNIRKKRQAELLELVSKNTAFKEEAGKLIHDAEQHAMDSIATKVDAAAREIGRERGYAFIINTDNHNLPYADPQMGESITAILQERLR